MNHEFFYKIKKNLQDVLSMSERIEAKKDEYVLMGTTSRADDAYGMAADFREHASYFDVVVERYKNLPGEEDAYAIFCLDISHISL